MWMHRLGMVRIYKARFRGLNPGLSSWLGATSCLAGELLFHAEVDAMSKDLLNVFI